jgi:hypothetical protein
VVVLSLLAAANAIQTNPADWQRRASEEGWRQVAQEISDYRQPGDVILIPRGCSDTGTSFPFYCIDFYQPELTPLIQTSGSLDQLKAQYAAAKGNVWIVLAPVYNKLFFKGNDQLRAWITQEGLRTDNFHLVDVAYPQSRKMGQLQDQLAPNRFKQITGTMEAGGDVLRLIRGTAAQPICLAGYPLNLQPGQEYLITFEYRAPSAIPGPMQVSVDAPDVNIPGRLFKYTARDLQPAWRTGYLPYWANGDPQIAGRARLIVRLDGVGSVELRNIRVYDSAPPAVVAARPTPSPMPAGLPSPTPAGLAPEQFKQLLGAGAAHGEILQVLRGSPEQPVALMAHPLTLTPGKHYRISFEYRAPTGTTGPFSVYVDAQDVGTPGRLFKYAAHDLPTNWRTASLQYTAGSDAPVATSARLIVRLDGLGSVEVRNIYVAEE